jgi:hypothetical protein
MVSTYPTDSQSSANRRDFRLVHRQCGEETFSADTMKRIEALLTAHPRPARVAHVPLYIFGAA